MTVRKLTHVGQVDPPDATPLDGNNIRSAIELSELCLRLRRLTPPRGVRRFASIEDAHKHRVQWEIDALAS